MTQDRWERWSKVGLAMAVAGALSACASAQETVAEWGDAIQKWAMPDKIEPMLVSLKDEYCVAPRVVAAYGNEHFKAGANIAAWVLEQSLDEEAKQRSLYCRQNMAGVILITDRVLNQSLDEMRQGIVAATEALELNIRDQQLTLARIARMRNLTLGEKLDPSFQTEIEWLDGRIEALSDRAEAKLRQLAETGGMSAETMARLEKAHEHFVNLRYYQAKVIVGSWLIAEAVRQQGWQVLAEPLAYVFAQDLAQAKRGGEFKATGDLVTSYATALPRAGQTVIAGTRVSSAIWDAADDEDFRLSLEKLNSPPETVTVATQTYAVEVEESTLDLGLPTVGEQQQTKAQQQS